MERDHPIARYLALTGEKQTEFAKRVGISDAYLSQIILRRRGVSLATGLKLEAATHNKVKVAELVRETA